MAIVTLRYWAAAKDAAGVAEETVQASTLAEALAAATDRAGGHRAAGDQPGVDQVGGDQAGVDQAAGDRAAAAPGGRRERLSAVLSRSSFLVDGQPAGTRDQARVPLAEGAVIEVLPPFAGG